jgi:hypothetical protein
VNPRPVQRRSQQGDSFRAYIDTLGYFDWLMRSAFRDESDVCCFPRSESNREDVSEDEENDWYISLSGIWIWM